MHTATKTLTVLETVFYIYSLINFLGINKQSPKLRLLIKILF